MSRLESLPKTASDGSRPGTIARPGDTCWRLDHADRLAVIIDAAAYFETLRAALIQARRQVLISAWDIAGSVPLLDPHAPPPKDGWPTRLSDLLRALTEARPELTVSILLWDFPMLYASDRELLPAWRQDWNPNPRMRLRLDSSGPVEAAHHRKVVVIDDRLVFLGGLDLAPARWDTRAHQLDDPRRRLPEDGTAYAGFHDMQVMMEGEPAATLGTMLRERWADVTDEAPLSAPSAKLPSPWPTTEADRLAVAQARDIPVALARTTAQTDDTPGHDEIARLIRADIAAARHWIYLEDQYLTARLVAEALAERLQDPDGPEVVAVLPEGMGSWLETATMGVGRERLVRHLRSADHHGRLRLVTPTVAGETGRLKVHTKLMIVDGRLLRHGSANLSNRSMGLDTELDWHVECAQTEDGERRRHDTAVQDLIETVVCDLLGEHLATPVETIRATLHETGSLLAVLDRHNGHPDRALNPINGDAASETLVTLVPDPVPGDFEKPVNTDDLRRELASLARFADRPLTVAAPAPPSSSATGHRAVVPAVVLGGTLVALGLMWRLAPMSDALGPDLLASTLDTARQGVMGPVLATLAVFLGSLLMAPILLLVTVAAVVLGPVTGFVCSLIGAMASAGVGFLLGRAVGRKPVHVLAGRWTRAARVLESLRGHGLKAVIVARVLPVLLYGLVSLACGALGLRWKPYLWGTLIGMTPVIAVACLFGEGLSRMLRAGTLLEALPLALGLGAMLLLARLGWSWLETRRRRS